jgi:hypothetical protein
LDQRRVVAASEEDMAVVIVVVAGDFGKKPGKRELQQWMESNFLEAAVASGKYRKHAVAEAFAAVVGARYVAVAVAVAVVVESHLKAKNGCPLDITG